MFWGLKLESGNRYSQLVEKPFHISHAAIAPTTYGSGEGCPVFPQMVIEVRAIVEKTDYIICYLDPSNGLLQQPLNLNISEGEEIVLYCSCSGQDGSKITVYLTGFFIEEPVYGQNLDDLELTNDECSVSDLEDEVEEDEGEGEAWEHQNLASLLFQDNLASDESDEEYVVGGKKTVPSNSLSPIVKEAGEKGSTENESKMSKKKRIKNRESIQQKQKPGKRKREDSSSHTEDPAPSDPGITPSPKKKKKHSEKKKDESGTQTSRSKTASKPKKVEKIEQTQQSSVSPPKKSKSKPVKLKGGTEIIDIEAGSGKIAKPGKRVFVRYTGRLANSKVFDSNVGAPKPFMFKLGQGEVIKGWDDGVQGMQVGGKRKLIVPPKQGYGASGAPPNIPPHAKLTFDVELVNVS